MTAPLCRHCGQPQVTHILDADPPVCRYPSDYAPLTYDVILSMDEAALNLAIEAYCFHRHYPGARSLWNDAAQQALERKYTASWERTMPLCLRYKIFWSAFRLRKRPIPQGMSGYRARTSDNQYDIPGGTTEHELRVALCRLALWRAVQEKEKPNGAQ